MWANRIQHVSKLTKESFNLKLELHHRRERQTALEGKLEAAEQKIKEYKAEQEEYLEINEQLVAELEKRDQAVEEAVGIIVGLEERIEQLMREREVVMNFDAEYKPTPSFALPDGDDIPSSPPTFDKALSRQGVTRMPSFLSEPSEGADALRSLYLPTGYTYSESTLPRLPEDVSVDGTERMETPDFSDLSQSSFVSVYGDKRESKGPDAPEGSPVRVHRKSESVEKWIQERPMAGSPPMIRNEGRKSQFLSINDVIESPLQRLEKLKSTLERNTSKVISTRQELDRSVVAQEPRKQRAGLLPVLTKTSFENQQGLPPTPDTISTSTLRHYKNSNDTLGHDSKGKTFLDSTSTIPIARSHAAYQTAALIRPRSAGETINSRREGHGWDTDTQDDFSSNASTFSAAAQTRLPQRAVTPDLFNFASFTASDSYPDFGRNMMFDHDDEPGLPRQTFARYNTLRQPVIADHPRSDDTERQVEYGSPPLDTSLRPYPPTRRSSLTHSTHLRKSQRSSSSTSSPIQQSLHQPTQTSTTTSTTSPPKKRTLTTRLFSKSQTTSSLPVDQCPITNTNTNPPSKEPRRPHTQLETYQNLGLGDSERGTATPPPIRRSRGEYPPVVYRPSSAGAQRLRRAGVFGGAGGREEVGDLGSGVSVRGERGSVGGGVGGGDGGRGGGEEVVQGRKKWFGIGRAGSLKR